MKRPQYKDLREELIDEALVRAMGLDRLRPPAIVRSDGDICIELARSHETYRVSKPVFALIVRALIANGCRSVVVDVDDDFVWFEVVAEGLGDEGSEGWSRGMVAACAVAAGGGCRVSVIDNGGRTSRVAPDQ